MAESLLPGKYTLHSSDNFEEYLKAAGVSFLFRKIITAAKPITEIKCDGVEWSLKTTVPFKTVEIKFKSGEEFVSDHVDGSGRKCKSTIFIEENRFVHLIQDLHTQEFLEDIRDFTEDEMTITLKAKDTTCVRVYKRVQE